MSNPNLVRKSATDSIPGEISQTQVDAIAAQDKNYLINGNLDFWQRGTSFSSGYTADRWFIAGTGTFSVTQSSDVPDSFSSYSLQSAVTSGIAPAICQRIESVNSKDLAGKTVTLSFKAKVIDNTGASIAVWMYYPSAADSWGSSFTISGTPITVDAAPVSGTWNSYSATVTLPANVVNGLEIRIVRGGASINTTTLLSQMNLTIGETAKSYRYFGRSYTEELNACKRYCQVLLPKSIVNYLVSNTNINGDYTGKYDFPVDLRAIPTASTPSWTLQQTSTPSLRVITTQVIAYVATQLVANSGGYFYNSTNIIADAEL